jgi:isopenicillin-N N-acyltransferase-like protein
MFVQKIIRPDGHQLIQLTEPGILGKIGMNSAGVGVCLNILAAGLPGYHIGGL